MNERELRLLRSIRDSLIAIHQDIRSIRDQKESGGEHPKIPPPSPIVNAELQIPERIERDNQSNSNREYRLQKWLTVGTWLAFVAAAIYAAIAYRQKVTMDNTFHQIENQNTLLRKQLEGTMSADIVPPSLYVLKNKTTGVFFVRLSTQNRGNLTTPDLHGSIDITLMSFPAMKTISKMQQVEIATKAIIHGTGWEKDISVPGLIEADQKYASQRKTIR